MDELKSVPYIVFESAESKSERTIKRLILALIISILVSLATNVAWMILWNQYEYVSESETQTYVQDGQGLNIIGSSNEVRNGTNSELHDYQETPN